MRHLRQRLPDSLRQALVQGLDDLRATGQPRELFSGTRSTHWTDIIDPELCLCPQAPTEQPPLRVRPRTRTYDDDPEPSRGCWQPADVEVDGQGKVRWRSWVNHLCSDADAALLTNLASLLELALPELESAAGRTLRGKRLQVVLGAFEHQLRPGDKPTRISDWHVDGTPAERIVATATSYLEVSTTLTGGAVVFASQHEMSNEDPQETLEEAPATGSMLVFDNTKLRHRVQRVQGHGRRLLVALHLVDPEQPLEPRAEVLPRLLASQAKHESLRELAYAMRRRFPDYHIPPGVYDLIWSFVGFGSGAENILEHRDASRIQRLFKGSRGFRGGTGTWSPDYGPVIGGTGLAGHLPVNEWGPASTDETDSE